MGILNDVYILEHEVSNEAGNKVDHEEIRAVVYNVGRALDCSAGHVVVCSVDYLAESNVGRVEECTVGRVMGVGHGVDRDLESDNKHPTQVGNRVCHLVYNAVDKEFDHEDFGHELGAVGCSVRHEMEYNVGYVMDCSAGFGVVCSVGHWMGIYCMCL